MSTKAIEKTTTIRKSLLGDNRGLTTVEYVIVLSLIAIAGIAIWNAFGAAITGRVTIYTGSINTLP